MAEPATNTPIKIDLGCGTCKVAPDFVGVDRFQMPGVDVIADIDGTLPFESDTVDLLVASHSLEHCANLVKTMQEVYRICRHGAQVSIVCPYFATHLNLANPYHLQCFNEHTPRFWSTREHESDIPTEEWEFPHAETWALGSSDHSDPKFDFRCVRLEFFYFPQYLALNVPRLRMLRKNSLDVCDQILYHLIVLKHPISQDEFNKLLLSTELFDFPSTALRREKDTGVSTKERLLPGAWHAARSMRDTASNTNSTSAAAPTDALQSQLQRFLDEAERLRSESREELERTKRALSNAQHRLALQDDELRQSRLALDNQRQDAHRLKANVESQAIRIQQLESVQRELTAMQDRGVSLTAAANLHFQHSSRTLERMVEWYRGMPCCWDKLPDSFQKLKDDALLSAKRQKGWGLSISENISEIPYRSYMIKGVERKVSRVLFAPVVSNLPRDGVLGVEVVDPSGQIVTTGTMNSVELESAKPAIVRVTPFTMNNLPGWELRIFARNLNIPLHVLEFRKHRKMGLGQTLYVPFCAFDAET